MGTVRKYALLNAKNHGEARPKNIIGKVLAEEPERKKNVEELMSEIKKTVSEVNSLSKEEVEKELRENYPELLEEKEEEKKELPGLEHTEEKVVLRYPPEPNGYPHIGHALSANLNYLYAEKYDGELILRFEDTNPEKEKLIFYDAIEDELSWAGIKWAKKVHFSDYFEKLIDYCTKLIKEGKAYACTCDKEKIRKSRWDKEACSCREREVSDSMSIWSKMQHDLPEGLAVIRFKGDMEAENASLRDPAIYRIIEHPHPKTGEKFRVYPNYDFAAAVMEGTLGITHVLRSEEFRDRTPLQKKIAETLGIKVPRQYVHFGRFVLEGTPTSKRKIRPLVEEGIVSGWDDPRLSTISGLRRRGIVPKTFQDLAVLSGPIPGRSLITWELLSGLNRKNIDEDARRVYVVKEPVEIKVKNLEKTSSIIPNHPQNEKLGKRKVDIKESVFIEKSDVPEKEGDTVMLKQFGNIKFTSLSPLEAEYDGDDLRDNPKIQFVPKEGAVEIELLTPGKLFLDDDFEKLNPSSLSKETVLGEKEVKEIPAGEIIQMERIGFGRIDSKDPLRIIFAGR